MHDLFAMDHMTYRQLQWWGRERSKADRLYLWMVVAGILLTVVLYIRTVSYPFVDWDDPGYIYENPELGPLTWEQVRTEFGREVMGNYHPITMLSYSLDLFLFGMDPGAMHGTGLVIHLLNLLLVVGFLRKLTGDPIIAALAGLLWTVHPLRVESVAWLSARKDLLMLLFGLLMCHGYLEWRKSQRLWPYVAAVASFALAGLSKGMAVGLVPCLWLIDLFQGRVRTIRSLVLDKVPFLMIAVVVGLLTIKAQSEVIANSVQPVSLMERILLGPANVLAYAVHHLVPIGLNVRYRYPLHDGELSGWYGPAGFIVFVLLVLYGWRTWNKERIGMADLGLWFFVINLLPVLQWLPVGDAIRADRYTYVAGIGASVVFAWALSVLVGSFSNRYRKYLASILVGGLVCGLLLITGSRIPTWSSSINVRSDIIANDPSWFVGYLDRSFTYERMGESTAALADLSRAVRLAGPKDLRPRYERGSHYLKHERYQEAIQDMLPVFQVRMDHPGLLPKMLFAQLCLGMCNDVERNSSRALEIDSTSLDIWNFRAACRIQHGDHRGAMADLLRSLEIDGHREETWLYLAWAFRTYGKQEMACRILATNLVQGELRHPWIRRLYEQERSACAGATGL